QTSGINAGQPLTNTAKRMANATLDWTLTPAFSMQLTLESRSDRFRGVDALGNEMYYKAYDVWHLGGQYQINERLTVSARVNNLLNTDFTSFQSAFARDANGAWALQVTDDYNNKDKARNLWLSVNALF